MTREFQEWMRANPRYNMEGYETGRMSALNGGSQENLKQAHKYLMSEEFVGDFYLSWTAGYLIGLAEREPRGRK